MAVSAIGQGVSVSAVRHAAATVLVLVGLVSYLYGPPLTVRLRDAAESACIEATGSRHRSYRLEWRTTSFSEVDVPHWACWDLHTPGRPARDLGWWAGY